MTVNDTLKYLISQAKPGPLPEDRSEGAIFFQLISTDYTDPIYYHAK